MRHTVSMFERDRAAGDTDDRPFDARAVSQDQRIG